MAKKRTKETESKASTKTPAIDWAALGYEENSDEFVAADEVVVNTGPVKFKVQAGKTYRIGFPFVAPGKNGRFKVLIKPIEHLKYYDEELETSVKFVMPKDEKLRKRVIDTFSSKPVNTHYLTPVIVYDTNDAGKVLSRKEVSYSLKIIAIPAGRYAKLREASEQFNLADYDFMVTLDGDEKTEIFQKMNFKAVTSKKDLNAKTSLWQKNVLVKLPEDEDDDPTPVSIEEIIAEAYEEAEEMVSVLGTRELQDSKIKAILDEWADVDDDEDDYADETESDEEDFDDEAEDDAEDFEDNVDDDFDEDLDPDIEDDEDEE
jgi:hypothetical protein